MLLATTAMATDVTVWCWAPEFNGAAMNEAIARYAAGHPDVNITVVDFAKADLEQKLQTQLASGQTEGLPDIVLIEDYGAQKYLLSFPGAFEPLTDKIDYSKFAPYKVSLASVDGQTYSLPFDSGASGLFYRSDLLAEAGYDAAALQDITWDQMIEIGKAVNAKTGKPMFSIDQNDAGAIRIMLQSAGTWYFNADGKPTSRTTRFQGGAGNLCQDAADPGNLQAGVWLDRIHRRFHQRRSGRCVYRRLDDGRIKADNMSGKWGVAPCRNWVSKARPSFEPWWFQLVRAVLGAGKGRGRRFPGRGLGQDVDFYQKILVDQGAFALSAGARGRSLLGHDAYFGGQAVWANFSDWQAAIPGVNYGIFTNEVDAAVAAQLPALAAGGSIDDAIAAIDAQVAQQIQ